MFLLKQVAIHGIRQFVIWTCLYNHIAMSVGCHSCENVHECESMFLVVFESFGMILGVACADQVNTDAEWFETELCILYFYMLICYIFISILVIFVVPEGEQHLLGIYFLILCNFFYKRIHLLPLFEYIHFPV